MWRWGCEGGRRYFYIRALLRTKPTKCAPGLAAESSHIVCRETSEHTRLCLFSFAFFSFLPFCLPSTCELVLCAIAPVQRSGARY